MSYPNVHMEPIAKITVDVADPITIGETGTGVRRIVPIVGGTVRGPRLTGRVLAAGADYQLLCADGRSELDARYAIETDDGALIYVINKGIRRGPTDLMAKLARGEPADPAAIYFRTVPRFETSAPAYQWLVQSLFIATGIREPNAVQLSLFEVR